MAPLGCCWEAATAGAGLAWAGSSGNRPGGGSRWRQTAAAGGGVPAARLPPIAWVEVVAASSEAPDCMVLGWLCGGGRGPSNRLWAQQLAPHWTRRGTSLPAPAETAHPLPPWLAVWLTGCPSVAACCCCCCCYCCQVLLLRPGAAAATEIARPNRPSPCHPCSVQEVSQQLQKQFGCYPVFLGAELKDNYYKSELTRGEGQWGMVMWVGGASTRVSWGGCSGAW